MVGLARALALSLAVAPSLGTFHLHIPPNIQVTPAPFGSSTISTSAVSLRRSPASVELPLFNKASGTCKDLAARLPGRIAFANESAYDVAQSAYYLDSQSELHPACIFIPASLSDISQFLKHVSCRRSSVLGTILCSSLATLPQFAIVSGGHALVEGANNVDGGITVDMRNFNTIALSSNQATVSIGPAAAWDDVYSVLDPHGVSVAGGRVNGVRAGGFLSGGGKSFGARRYGWSCDNVLAYEIVLADGSVVTASVDSRADLWLALKGGSNNFGIITRYEMSTFRQSEMWGGVVLYNYTSTALRTQAEAFSRFMQAEDIDLDADAGILLGFLSGIFVLQAQLFHLQPEAAPATYRDFLSSDEIIDSTIQVNSTYNIVTAFSQKLPPNVPRAVQLVYSFRNADAATYLLLIQSFEAGVRSISQIPGLIVQYLVQPQPIARDPNVMGLDPDDTDVVMGLVTMAYARSEDAVTVRAALEGIVSAHREVLEQRGVLLPFIYLNYADATQDVFGSWGAQSKRFLQDVSRRYDPLGTFQRQVPGGFQLFK